MINTTSDERREVAEAIRHYAEESDESAYEFIHGYWPNDLADLIDPTCTYEPTETLNYWDAEDREHETNQPDIECGTFSCSRCGNEMLYGDDCGWFDTEPPYTPHFKFCPNCSARVLPLKLYDKVVSCDE